MLALLTVVALATYKAPADPLRYTATLVLDGDIPMLGGQTGRAEARLDFRVAGDQVASNGELSVRVEATSFRLRFNGEAIPLTMEDARPFLPPTTLRFSPSGRTLKVEAPEVQVPVRIPGLHPRSLTEVVFLPIEWPGDNIPRGSKWSFCKPLGERDADFEAELTAVNRSTATVGLKASQEFTSLEDSALMIVSDKTLAHAEALTHLTASGSAQFDLVRGIPLSYSLRGEALTTVRELGSGKESRRRMKLQLRVALSPR